MNALRIRHLENCLTQYDRVSRLSLPLDKFLAEYFSAHRTIKPPDKHFISEQAEDILRWRGLLDVVAVAPVSWASRLKTYYCSTRWKLNTRNKQLELHTRCSFPQELFLKLQLSLGQTQAFPTCLVLNEAAPRHLRVNVARITRDNLYRSLTYKGLGVEKSPEVPTGLHLVSNHRLLDLAEYRDGYFEMQDVASQMIAHSIACSPGDIVLDYCAGTGGKASVFGVFLENKGRLILHDIRADVLRRAKQRVARAGIGPVHIALGGENEKTLEPFVGRCHWVICDVPCTSTGSLRRNPHLKWHYSDNWLEELVTLQRRIVETAIKYMRPEDGKLVYITRSLLREENFDQVKYFHENLKLRPTETPEFSLPRSLGHDGFFSCVLELVPPTAPSSAGSGLKTSSEKTTGTAKKVPPLAMAMKVPVPPTAHNGKTQPPMANNGKIQPPMANNGKTQPPMANNGKTQATSLVKQAQPGGHNMIPPQSTTRSVEPAGIKPKTTEKSQPETRTQSKPDSYEDLALDEIDVMFVESDTKRRAFAALSSESCVVKTEEDPCGSDVLPPLL